MARLAGVKVCITAGLNTNKDPTCAEIRSKSVSETFVEFFLARPIYHRKSLSIAAEASEKIGLLEKRKIFYTAIRVSLI